VNRLQDAAYGAQWAACLPISDLGRRLFIHNDGPIPVDRCAAYLDATVTATWFIAAFAPSATTRVHVVERTGVSVADRDNNTIAIGTEDRQDPRRCEHACLHELAHLVTPDRDADGTLREPPTGDLSSHGHHHAWRANFVFITRMALGKPAAARLRDEFNAWGLPTR
jgi:hypothetical protein